jgi:type III secretory pathway component EscV
MILSHGNEGPLAAGHVVAAFGGFLMGGDVVIGLIIFSILHVVEFMVITILIFSVSYGQTHLNGHIEGHISW